LNNATGFTNSVTFKGVFMGFFSSISEGIFAAKVILNIAKHLNVHTSQLPEWVSTGTKACASVHRSNEYTPELAALSILETQGHFIVKGMTKK